MIENLSKKIEICAHVGIILMTFLVGYVVIRLSTVSETLTTISEATLARPNSNAPARRILAPGMKMSMSGIDWENNNRTLLLVLTSSCKPCKESASFYKKIIEELRSIKNVRLVAVLPQGGMQGVASGEKYLHEMGLMIDEVMQVTPGSVGVAGLPALILADNTGTVENVWIGRLPSDKEVEVIKALKCDQC
jgi:hypothetical protein